MKKIIISNNCVQCGACILATNLLKEELDGTIVAKGDGYISDEEAVNFEKIVRLCPAKAIELEDSNELNTSNIDNLKNLKKKVFDEIHDYNINVQIDKEMKFEKNEYQIQIGETNLKSRFKFRSDSQAELEGLHEFDRIMYSQRRAIIQNILVQYKQKKLYKFLEYKKEEGNFYFEENKKIENILKRINIQLKELTANEIDLSNELNEFNVMPDFGCDEIRSYQIRNFEDIYITGAIMDELESLSWYDTYVNTDYKSLSSRDAYCYELTDVVNIFKRHILDETAYIINDSKTYSILEDTIKPYKNDVNKSLKNKCDLIIKSIDKYLGGK